MNDGDVSAVSWCGNTGEAGLLERDGLLYGGARGVAGDRAGENRGVA